MKKIIILEGADGSGKTTLAQRLYYYYGYRTVKTGPPDPTKDVTLSYLSGLIDAVCIPGRTVFDRLHIGEAIYGPLLRGVDRMGIDGLMLIEQFIALNDIALIICSPPWEVLIEGWRCKDDLLKTEDQLHTVYGKYLEHATRLGLTVYDWTAPDAETVLKGLIEC